MIGCWGRGEEDAGWIEVVVHRRFVVHLQSDLLERMVRELGEGLGEVWMREDRAVLAERLGCNGWKR